MFKGPFHLPRMLLLASQWLETPPRKQGCG